MPETDRSYFEPRFGRDFSDVRVHHDAGAAESANAINAQAYTIGRNIVFGSGRYQATTDEGRKLLAHELTHVVQQDNAGSSPPEGLIQRQANIREAPADVRCTLITGGGTPTGESVMFNINSYSLTPSARNSIRAFAENWLRGARDLISIEGYASEDGPQSLNWRLSCQRARAVKDQLLTLGVSPDKIQVAAHGETSEFGSGLDENRRVVISVLSPVAVPLPAPAPPPATDEENARQRQVVCVRRLGGCPNTRPGGIPSSEEIDKYNEMCRSEVMYTGPNVTPTSEECLNPPEPAEPVEVTVVDDSDYVGWAASATRIGEIYMTDVNSMVVNVLAAAGNRPISRLNILDHGNADGIEIGNDWITSADVDAFVPQLSRLRGHFASGAFVHLQHCEAGQNLELMRQLAAAFGVPVYAGTSYQNPVYRINFGDYVRCNPDGTCDKDVGRP